MTDIRRNISILFFTLVVVMLGFGLIIPIMPFYVESFGAGGSALGLLMATYAVMQFMFAPIWGSLSDRYGRKPILMVGILGNIISQIISGLATGLWMLFLARALGGILSSATLPTAMAYISDSTSHEERGGGLGKLGAAMGLGMLLGPGIGGWLAARSLSLPFFLAAGLSAIAWGLIAALLPESLPPEKRVGATPGSRGPRLSLMWRALRGPLGFMFGLSLLLSFGLTNFEAIFGLYALNRFGYGPGQVGLLLMFVGLLGAAMQGMLAGPLIRRFGEVTIIRASLVGTSVGFLLMSAASSLPGILATIAFFITSNAMLNPTTGSLISKKAQGGQGMAMGLNNSFLSLGRILGPAWAGLVFDVHMEYPFYTGAIITMIGFAASWLWLTPAPQVAPEQGFQT